ncbi:MAG: GpE family phage tail protein [Pseudomonadota bacterium]|nr:GpE family phage tail protein [Pseudomonadota bacterium]
MANIASIFPGFMSLDRMAMMSVEELMRWHDKALQRHESK